MIVNFMTIEKVIKKPTVVVAERLALVLELKQAPVGEAVGEKEVAANN